MLSIRDNKTVDTTGNTVRVESNISERSHRLELNLGLPA